MLLSLWRRWRGELYFSHKKGIILPLLSLSFYGVWVIETWLFYNDISVEDNIPTLEKLSTYVSNVIRYMYIVFVYVLNYTEMMLHVLTCCL